MAKMKNKRRTNVDKTLHTKDWAMLTLLKLWDEQLQSWPTTGHSNVYSLLVFLAACTCKSFG
jgi:hypothetical protein